MRSYGGEGFIDKPFLLFAYCFCVSSHMASYSVPDIFQLVSEVIYCLQFVSGVLVFFRFQLVTKCHGITVHFSFACNALCMLFFLVVHLISILFLRWCRMRFSSVHLGSKRFPANTLAKKKKLNRSTQRK